MSTPKPILRERRTPHARSLVLGAMSWLWLVGCAGMTPEQVQLGTALLSAVGQNYGGDYYQEVSQFYQSMNQASQQASEAAQSGAGYDPLKVLFGGNGQSATRPSEDAGYEDDYAYEDAYEDGYEEGYEESYAEEDYESSVYEESEYVEEEYEESEYADEGYEGTYEDDAYAEEYETEVTTEQLAEVGILALDVAIVRQLGDGDLEALDNGAVVYDGDGDPSAADKLQIFFRPNVEAYVYVVSVDATGWVQPIFPNAFPDSQNPLPAGSTTLIPGAGYWLTLDQWKGTEHLYFIASHERRYELETQLADFAQRTRPVADDPVAISVPSVVEQAFIQERGFLGVRPGEATTIAAKPTAHSFGVPGVDLVVTRFFDHR